LDSTAGRPCAQHNRRGQYFAVMAVKGAGDIVPGSPRSIPGAFAPAWHRGPADSLKACQVRWFCCQRFEAGLARLGGELGASQVILALNLVRVAGAVDLRQLCGTENVIIMKLRLGTEVVLVVRGAAMDIAPGSRSPSSGADFSW
jgi:hypothetical protein